MTEPDTVRPLPGGLDNVPVFNSNSPEVVQSDGILLSTFPPGGMKNPEAHLNYLFDGRFDLFLHHINNALKNGHARTLYIGVILNNPSDKTVHLHLLEASSYLSQPDSPFVSLESNLDNRKGNVYAGPGDRVMDDFLRKQSQKGWPREITIPPHGFRVLMNLPIPDDKPKPHINGRSTLIKVRTDGPVYAASLAMFAPVDQNGQERPPEISEWQKLLSDGSLCTPRDVAATAPNAHGKFAYGRVAGVDRGSVWEATIADDADSKFLSVEPDQAITYPISTVQGGTFGTKQIQAAPMLVRYPDTAYAAHGNYGVHYILHLPIRNSSTRKEKIAISFQTPIKNDQAKQSLDFYDAPENKVFYRGTVSLWYRKGILNRRRGEIHLVEMRGQKGEPLAEFELTPGRKERLRFELYYPPDATPPQVLTIKTTAVD